MALIKLPWQQPQSPPTALEPRGNPFSEPAPQEDSLEYPLSLARESFLRREQISQLRALFACQRGAAATTVAPGPTKYLTQADCKDMHTHTYPREHRCVCASVCEWERERAVARALQAMSS